MLISGRGSGTQVDRVSRRSGSQVEEKVCPREQWSLLLLPWGTSVSGSGYKRGCF